MPAGMGEEERFAAAVEHGTTPASLGWGEDGAESVARELEIVAMLRSGAPTLAPDPATKDRAKRRLMAAFAQEFGQDVDVAMEYAGGDATAATGPLQVLAPVALATREAVPRTEVTEVTAPPRTLRAGRHSAPEPEHVAEPEHVVEPDDAEPDNVRPLRRRDVEQRRAPRRGAAVLGAAAAAALVALAGGGTFASQDALPGDSMYGVKRVAESTGYALTFGEKAKARRHLEQAQRRLDEVEGLVARGRTTTAGASAKASDPELVRNTMHEFDTDTSEGSRQLLSGTKPDTGQVDEVRTWATQQSQRLTQIRSALPAPDQADGSLALLDRVLGETAALQSACAPAASGSADGSASAGSTEVAQASASGDGACAVPGSTTVSGRSRTTTTTAPEDTRTSAGASATAHSDDQDGNTDTSTGADADSSRVTTKGKASRSDTTSARRGRDSDAGDGGSDSGTSDGNLSVPLPVSRSVSVPPLVPGLPGVTVGSGDDNQ